LAEWALGWLGWSEDQALAADVNAILVGFAGKQAMLAAIFGTADDTVENAHTLPEFGPGMMGR
jgi:hypothetical protein